MAASKEKKNGNMMGQMAKAMSANVNSNHKSAKKVSNSAVSGAAGRKSVTFYLNQTLRQNHEKRAVELTTKEEKAIELQKRLEKLQRENLEIRAKTESRAVEMEHAKEALKRFRDREDDHKRRQSSKITKSEYYTPKAAYYYHHKLNF